MQSLFSLASCVRFELCLDRQLSIFVLLLTLTSSTLRYISYAFFVNGIRREKAGYPLSCTGLMKGDMFRSSVISLVSVLIPHISIVTTNRINVQRSHVKRLLFYANFNQTRTAGLSTILSKILNRKFHENPLGYSQGVPCG